MTGSRRIEFYQKGEDRSMYIHSIISSLTSVPIPAPCFSWWPQPTQSPVLTGRQPFSS